jgi:hypothetical protein
MIRAIAFGCTLIGSVLLTCGFAWPPDYADQSRADVATCVEYARYTSPHFEAAVREVDLATGRVDIERTANDARGEVAFSKCLLAVRQWRLIERNLPRSPEPHPAELATMAGTPPISVIR